MTELVALVAVSVSVGLAGLAMMAFSEFSLYNFAQTAGFTFQHGRYNLARALKPHVLRGSHCGHDVVITYSLGEYLSESLNKGTSSLSYALSPQHKIRVRVAPALPWAKRATRSGDRRFDRWIKVEGTPKAFVKRLLADGSIKARLKDTISPTLSFTSTLMLSPGGPLVLRHKSAFLTQNQIRRDLELLGDIARLIGEHSPEAAE